jgi:hypothetical protein
VAPAAADRRNAANRTRGRPESRIPALSGIRACS